MAESFEAREMRRELNVLWTNAHTVVSGYIRSMVIDFHLAEDVLQETAATVAEKFDTYDRSRPFLPWALGIAKNKILHALRTSSRDRLVFDENIVTQLSVTYAELQPDASDMQIALERCVERVQGRSKKLLEMRYVREQTAGAIAAATGMAVGAVTVSLHRIRKALSECMEQQLATLGNVTRSPKGGPDGSTQ